MGFLTREKKDGKRTAGYGVYLIGALFALGSVVYLRRRLAEGAGAPRAKGGAPSNVAPITQPASTVSPIEVKDPHPPEGRVPSYRQDQNGGAHPAVKRRPASRTRVVQHHQSCPAASGAGAWRQ